jgi:hypothetical protein
MNRWPQLTLTDRAVATREDVKTLPAASPYSEIWWEARACRFANIALLP